MVNCYDNGKARLLTNDTALKLLESACGMIYKGRDLSSEIMTDGTALANVLRSE